jgi:hypothetical protein
MIKPYTERQQTMIVNNVAKALSDPSKLSKQAYNYLYLCSGFIAHYDHKGFMSYYTREGNLRRDIMANSNANQWKNFTPNDRDYHYYMTKAAIYNGIMDAINQGA